MSSFDEKSLWKLLWQEIQRKVTPGAEPQWRKVEKPREEPVSSAKLCKGTGLVLANFRIWNSLGAKRKILLQQSHLLFLFQVSAEATCTWSGFLCHSSYSRSPCLDNHVTLLIASKQLWDDEAFLFVYPPGILSVLFAHPSPEQGWLHKLLSPVQNKYV